MSTPRPSTSKAPALEPDVQMLNIGTQCADPLCRLVDFLPFKCPHCESSFCQEHYKVDAHKCPEYDETKHNRVAPDCPFCHIPVAVRPGQDPNERLELHFERECSVLTGKTQAKNTPHCAKGTCRKVLFSPIKCDTCRQQFCPAHRFPSDHTCRAPQSRLLGSTQSQVSEAMRLPSFSGASDAAKNLNAKASVAVANVKRSVASAAANAQASTPGKPAGNNVFRQTDRVVSLPSSSTSSLPAAATSTTPLTTATPLTLPSSTIPNPHNESETGPTPIINILNVQSFVPRSIFATA